MLEAVDAGCVLAEADALEGFNAVERSTGIGYVVSSICCAWWSLAENEGGK